MALTYDTSNCNPIVREELASITECIIFLTMNTRHGWEIDDKTISTFVRRFNLINKSFRYLCMAETTHMRYTDNRVWVDKFGLQWINEHRPYLYLNEDAVRTYWFGLKTNAGKDTDAAFNKNFITNAYRDAWDQSPFYLRDSSIETIKGKFNELSIQAS